MAELNADDRSPLIVPVELEEEEEEDEEENRETNGFVTTDATTEAILSPRANRSGVLGREVVVCVFVVAFDTKKGNIVEWQYPEEIQLEGVEFKAIASGLHSISSDFVYFKHHQLYGLSCYEKLSVDSVEERGARMRAVGILAVGYSDLHIHMEFLKEQTSWQVRNPGKNYEQLKQFFWSLQSPSQLTPPSNPLPSTQTAAHPAGCFSQFLRLFGAQVFVLWRLALLSKRILVYSPPPIGAACYRVYCICLLSCHNLQQQEHESFLITTGTDPLFYVNIADIDDMKPLSNFIACTTEQIFKTKPDLYDAYIDNDTITSSSARLEPLLKISTVDQHRYNKLTAFIRSSNTRADDNLLCARFFQRLNTELFQTLLDMSRTEDHMLLVDDIIRIGLDPDKDRVFLTELIQYHNLPVTVQRQQDVFSCCI